MHFEDAFPQPEPLYPIKSWTDVPPDITGAEIHGLAVKDFAPLRALEKLHALRAVCDTPKQYETVGTLSQLRWLALDHCGTTGLAPLGGLKNLRALSLFAFKAASLAGLEGMAALEYLQIEHAPRIASLEPIAACRRLRWLRISTPASGDASRKTIKVESLAPLSQLTALEVLSLMGVEPRSDGLRPLAHLKRMKTLSFSHVFSLPMAEFAGLAAALPEAVGHCLQPTYAPSVRAICPTCQEADLVCLTAPPARAKARLCPRCDATKLAAHEAEFERLKALRP